MNQQEIVAYADRNIAAATEALEKFAKDLLERPEYATGWADSLFSTTAKLAVGKYIKDLAESECPLHQIVDSLEEMAISGASKVSSSTSMSSNRLHQETTACYAEAYKMLKRRIRPEDRVKAD